MYAQKVELLEDEEVLFDRGGVVFTNQRVLANWRKKGGEEPANEVLIRDIATAEKITGGQDRRLTPGLQLLAVGLVLAVIEVFVAMPGRLDGLVFIAGAVAILVAVYIIIGALFGPKPHTTILFVVLGGRDIGVSFPGHGNSDAEELERLYRHAKSLI